MSEHKKSRRTKTLDCEPTHKFTHSLHNGMNYFHELNTGQFKIRKTKKSHTFRSNSIIEGTPIYQNLKQNKIMLERIKTQVNQLRESQFNDYLKKSNRYQELLSINDNKKKRLSTLNTRIGAIVRKSVIDSYPKQTIYRIQINRIKIEGWKPESREGHTILVNNKDEAILIGGHCSYPFSTIHVYSFTSNTWIKQIQSEIPRSYHSAVIYKNRFGIIFGGMGLYNKSRKSRECYNSISLFDINNHTFKNIKMHNEQSVEPRRCHSSTLLGKYMLVFGGINSKKQYLNDFIYLDLKELRWYHKEYKIQGKELQLFLQYGIAKHCSFSTFKYRKSYSFYSSEYEDNQSILFIGGFNQKEEENPIFQLVLNRYVPTFKKVEFSGTPPSPTNPIIEKYVHNPDTVLIISGEIGERQIRLFKYKEKSFTFVNNYSSLISLGGTGSSLSLSNGSYYLFFGLGEEGYLGEITKFSIEEQKKQNDKRKQAAIKHQFLKENDLISLESSDKDMSPYL